MCVATNEDEWGEFLHLPGEKFHDFSKIRAEIIRDTEAKTGRNAGKSVHVAPRILFTFLQECLLYPSIFASSLPMVSPFILSRRVQ